MFFDGVEAGRIIFGDKGYKWIIGKETRSIFYGFLLSKISEKLENLHFKYRKKFYKKEIAWIEIYNEFKGQGLSHHLLEKLNEYLDENGYIGVLRNQILGQHFMSQDDKFENQSTARTISTLPKHFLIGKIKQRIYKEHGWKRIAPPFNTWMYRMPKKKIRRWMKQKIEKIKN
jgi:GNAT superfamily N-acetyltransferase